MLPYNFKDLCRDDIFELYYLVWKHDLNTKYLMDNYFYIYFEKQANRLTDEQYSSIFESLIDHKYFKDVEFWQSYYTKSIESRVFEKKEHVHRVLKCMIELRERLNASNIDAYILKLENVLSNSKPI